MTACSDRSASRAADIVVVQPVAAGHLAIGTNLDGLAYWSPALPVIDLVKASGQWLPQSDATYDTGEPVPRDARGWVTALPPGANYRRVHLNVLHNNPAAPPAARYVVLYSGRGTLSVATTGGAQVVENRPGRLLVQSAQDGTLSIDITTIDPADPLRDVHLIREDLLPRYEAGETFNPAFVEKIRPFHTLRFMDWMNTNTIFDKAGAPITSEIGQRRAPQLDWADRSRPETMRWADGSRGVPVEALVELANRTGAEPWFNMPINASDDYVRGFATYVRDHLDGRRRIHVELSNEVWNFSFPQARYSERRAHETLGADVKWMEWYGKRTAEVGAIWNTVFGEAVRHDGNNPRGDPGRVLVVYNTQFGWQGLEDLGLNTEHWVDSAGNHVRASDYFDEYAITGYYDGTMNTPAVAGTVMSWWRDSDGGYGRAIAALRNRIATFNAPYYVYHARKAAENGLRLVTYESGFGEYTPPSQHQNQAYTTFLANLQRRPEFHELETANYTAFKAAGGSLYMNFGIIGTPGKWGNWSALEGVDQKTSPRYQALIDWIAANPADGPHAAVAER
ncbi:hypothetical protein KX816_09050 [Sphingosinicellaceae bacterium]|nr:hypothetical protein KX816_09050 [Sphingosinicellaceae bacterium]